MLSARSHCSCAPGAAKATKRTPSGSGGESAAHPGQLHQRAGRGRRLGVHHPQQVAGPEDLDHDPAPFAAAPAEFGAGGLAALGGAGGGPFAITV